MNSISDRIRRPTLALASGLLAIGLAPPSEAADAAKAWKAVAASGKVEARTGESTVAWERVARGDELLPATLVRTGRTGRTTLTRAASLIIVDPDTELELPERPRPGLETTVVQTSGSVLYEVDSRAEPHFEVVTPYLVAGVKGTSFLVTVDENHASVAVQTGLVEVLNPETGSILSVGPGEFVSRDRDDDLERIEQHDQEQSRRAARRLARHAPRAADSSKGLLPHRPASDASGPDLAVADSGNLRSAADPKDDRWGANNATADDRSSWTDDLDLDLDDDDSMGGSDDLDGGSANDGSFDDDAFDDYSDGACPASQPNCAGDDDDDDDGDDNDDDDGDGDDDDDDDDDDGPGGGGGTGIGDGGGGVGDLNEDDPNPDNFNGNGTGGPQSALGDLLDDQELEHREDLEREHADRRRRERRSRRNR